MQYAGLTWQTINNKRMCHTFLGTFNIEGKALWLNSRVIDKDKTVPELEKVAEEMIWEAIKPYLK